jgi:LacI family transcriptional regulator, galactose operon repressor
MNNITLKNIADLLDISVSTVSRALNGHPDIHADTKKVVNQTAQELNYHPNIVARSLQAKRSNQIGIIVPEIKHAFFASAISGIEDVAYNRGYTVIVAQSNEEFEREKINLNSLYTNRVAGVLVSLSETTIDTDYFDFLLKEGLNIVFFDRTPENIEACKVQIDDYQSSLTAVEYLINKGYKKIVHLAGPKKLRICQLRKQGYEDAMANKGLEENIKCIEGSMHETSGYNAVENIFNNGSMVDAIFAVNDPVAIGALKKLKELKIKIPDEVALMGFSNNPITELVDPKLTTTEQPAYEMGKKAAELLIEQIESNSNSNEENIVILPTKMIKREST